MARIFWDTNLFIYLFEQNAEWAPRVVELREKMLTRGDQLLTSWLTVGEVLTKPKELRNTVLAKSYLDFFQSGSLELIPFDFEAAQRYSEIRSRERVRPADSIQLRRGSESYSSAKLPCNANTFICPSQRTGALSRIIGSELAAVFRGPRDDQKRKLSRGGSALVAPGRTAASGQARLFR